jgi:hypothetical protein
MRSERMTKDQVVQEVNNLLTKAEDSAVQIAGRLVEFKSVLSTFITEDINTPQSIFAEINLKVGLLRDEVSSLIRFMESL